MRGARTKHRSLGTAGVTAAMTVAIRCIRFVTLKMPSSHGVALTEKYGISADRPVLNPEKYLDLR
jgi:hypothetical protein